MSVVPPSFPSPAEVVDIVDTGDPVRRNFRITVGYWRIASAMRERLRGGATWCAFGTWASRQAGSSIRKEDLERQVARRLRATMERHPILREVHQALRVPETRILRLVGNLSQGLPGIDRAARALADGNGLIFREIGSEFSRYLAHGPAAFAAGLRPGPPPGGQDLLRTAFEHYGRAEGATDAAARAQLIFLGNVQIAYHEQTAAQPLIREAMDASLLDVADTRRLVLERLDEVVAEGPLGGLHTGIAHRIFNSLADEISLALREVARVVITDRLMSIEMPNGQVLRLGSDVPAAFPPSLARVTVPAVAAQLVELDLTPGTTRGSGTVDWSNLADRMHYLTDFFRCYQEDESLFAPPFADADLQAIQAGDLPGGV